MAKSVLVVDDEPIVGAVLARGLKDAGYEAVSCSSGQAALDLLRGQPFDLLITDLRMPAMTGYELTKLARAQIPSLPVIHVTGWEPPATPPDTSIPVVMKPFEVEAILRIMEDLLK